jgi:hypothetical protein
MAKEKTANTKKRRRKLEERAAKRSAISSEENEVERPVNPPYHRHPFETNSLDHCETPVAAYQHIQPFLEALCGTLGIRQYENLRIWDPYYCDASVKRHLSDLGFNNVINENVDFYAAVERGEIPPHDVLLTNPPYSGDHIERLLEFVVSRKTPFCLLMPNWVARKPEYKASFGDRLDLFYLSPVQPYTYVMPSWAEKPEHVTQDGQTTPYLSSWYIGNAAQTSKLQERMDSIAKRQINPSWVVAKTIKGLKWKTQKLNKRKAGKT